MSIRFSAIWMFLFAALPAIDACLADPPPPLPIEPDHVEAPVPQPGPVVAQPGASIGDLTRCPVSGGRFRVTEASPVVIHRGERIFACCAGCERRLTADPERFLAALRAK